MTNYLILPNSFSGTLSRYPFSLSIENQKDVILKDMTPKISFNFKEGGDIKKVTPQSLLSVLSQGEKRALYILNLLFEVKFRIKNNLPTLFIVDDIADSFDYKNKYSIIEYFRELSLIEHFSFIFLTHNFDFHRTISSRLSISRKKRLFTLKNDSGLSFGKEKYQNNPFSTWKNLCHKNTSCLIACIPLVRNLVEYSEGNKSQNYLKLTSLLHYKGDSEDITILDLQGIYRDVIKERHDLVLANPEEKLLDVVFIEADDISSKNEESIEIEYKIVLSISIRLKAEIFMINKINDTEFATSLKKNQTIRLYERYQNDFPGDYGNLSILSQVNLMTPENIHLNAFMYEPILDMSALHLYELYHNIKALS
jgi:energy-coupling factor transporter ATP-binding protein EcfA2